MALTGKDNHLRGVALATSDGRFVLFRADAIQNLLPLIALFRDAQVDAAAADYG